MKKGSKKRLLTDHEADIICVGLDMVREEREDELDIIIDAIKNPDPEKVMEIRQVYEEKKVSVGVFISKLKAKVLKLKKD